MGHVSQYLTHSHATIPLEVGSREVGESERVGMSLGIVIKGPEGLVLAAESRVTLTVAAPNAPQFHVTFDNATKLLTFEEPHSYVGAVTYGQAAIGQKTGRTAASYIPEFSATLPPSRLPVKEFAQKLSDFYMQQWSANMPSPYNGPDMTFVVAGFDQGAAYGSVFQFDLPGSPSPSETTPDPDFGITWGGQREIVDRLVSGYDPRLPGIVQTALNLQPNQVAALIQQLGGLQLPIPIQVLALQDCVDLAVLMIRTTIAVHQLTVTVRGVGGPIDVATITRQNGLEFVQRKRVSGEPGQQS